MIVVPTAFLFLGADAATAGTFGLGFVTVPAIMNFMPGGSFFGAMWFGLLFLAAVTSTLSMLQPAIAFLEDGFGLKRRASVAILGVITAIGASGTIYFSRNSIAMDHADFWCNFMMIIAATCQVLIFGWIIGAERGVREMNRGADFHVPRLLAVLIRFITPLFLVVVLVMWVCTTGPDYWHGMNPSRQGIAAERSVYAQAIEEHLAGEDLAADEVAVRIETILGSEGQAVDAAALPDWLQGNREQAEEARRIAAADANIARLVFLGVLAFFIFLIALADIACRNRIGRMIDVAERAGLETEASP
jgi:hypothetical protein